MEKNMARLDEIETFVAIIEEGSLSAAARRSGLALSAVSRRLKDLEARMGVMLLRRTT
ncbi:MAG: helix-turn-helix domain-containing protein, partial [Mangrovicoccus sp.]